MYLFYYLLISSVSLTAYTSTTEQTENQSEIKELRDRVQVLEKKLSKKSKKSRRRNKTNRDNREDLKLGFSWGPGFYHESEGSTLTTKYYLNGDNLILAEFFDGGENDANTNQEDTIRFALGWQHFVGDSFYVTAKSFFNRTDRSGYWFPNQQYDSRYQGIGFSLEIGNEWQWKNFFLGVNWLGGSVMPIRINSDDPADAQRSGDVIGFDDDDFFGLHIHIGAAF